MSFLFLKSTRFYILAFQLVVFLSLSHCTEPSVALKHHAGHKFHEVFQLKQERYADLPAAKISEMMKPNCLDVSS